MTWHPVAVIDATGLRAAVSRRGIESLRVDDMTRTDLEHISWSGTALHVASVAKALDRIAGGEVEYLVVRAPDGLPLAKGGIDYLPEPSAGTLWQLATHPELQSLGIGTRLILAAEQRIAARGRRWARLGVETSNTRASQLYRRLGYEPSGTESASWKQQTPEGTVIDYQATLTVMRKRLS